MNQLFKTLSQETFFEQYWQRRPYLFRQALPDFSDYLTPEELAGLALEEEVDSRLITRESNGAWSLQHGPLEPSIFSQLSESDWTLLVQSVDSLLPDTAQLLQHFSFIPGWRLDDIMVSYATPGGGVGPHIDQYDVFLVQGSGQRRWQVGTPQHDYEFRYPHPEIKQIAPFQALIDEVLQPGDVLYVPPNTPHDGVAVTPCMTYSVGFRAPSEALLVQQLLSNLAAQADHQSNLYQDQSLSGASTQALPPSALSWAKNALAGITDRQLISAFGEIVTEPKMEFEPEPIQSAESITALLAKLEQGKLEAPLSFHLAANCRFTYFQHEAQLLVFINGKVYEFSITYAEPIKKLLENRNYCIENVNISLQDIEFVNRIANLIKDGWVFFKH
ncbi:MAG: cupin domain-containing protein [Gammaproteobacteria bacterium]|nr:cupin domain-containing protein [Gammaproteobacteria bacterium]